MSSDKVAAWEVRINWIGRMNDRDSDLVVPKQFKCVIPPHKETHVAQCHTCVKMHISVQYNNLANNSPTPSHHSRSPIQFTLNTPHTHRRQ